MLKTGSKIERKKDARLWILAAIQRHSVSVDKGVEAEIKRFVRRIQRDIVSLERAKVQLEQSRKAEIAQLMRNQIRDEKDRRLRFENAIRK